MDVAASWRASATLLVAHRDILDGRPDDGAVPAALEARGWAEPLLSLDDATLERLESAGEGADWPPATPPSLRALVASVREVCRFPRDAAFASPTDGPAPARRRFESARKQRQIDAFAGVVTPLASRGGRVLDVGSGHGHLTRALAERLGMPVVGLERDEALAARARTLAESTTSGTSASFATTDVLSDGLSLDAHDCVVGLHACGELGDAMVMSAARAGASLALLGCCLQKRRPESRIPLFGGDHLDSAQRAALELPRAMLGLSNLTARDEAVEASRTENLRARERRLALHRLLTESGFAMPLGAEIEGLNRRAAHAELPVLVERAFALRGRPAPSPAALDVAARWAALHHARMRRLALPRSLLGRPLEVFVLLDRAAYLEAQGYEVTTAVLFPASVSARNLVLTAVRSLT